MTSFSSTTRCLWVRELQSCSSLGSLTPQGVSYLRLADDGWSLASQGMQSRQLLSGLKLLVRAVFKTTGWVKMLSLALAGFELTGPKLP